MQKEWTEARRELESERLRVGNLTIHRDQSVNQALDRVDTLRKELTDALKALSTAETRAQVAEVRPSCLLRAFLVRLCRNLATARPHACTNSMEYTIVFGVGWIFCS